MECKRCGNRDPEYFYMGHKGYYCRKCAVFKRILLDEEVVNVSYEVSKEVGDYHFDYALTPFQLQASRNCLLAIKNSDVLLKCATGTGKTEIVVESISAFLKEGKKVCYAISRREVVIELAKRFMDIFKNATVTAVYGDHHEKTTGDLIVCTTHQLYRYYKTFDLLIIDEADAFPLKDNHTLMNIAINSCRGNIIYSTATVNDFLESFLKRRKYQTVELNIRPSLKPLIVPKVFYLNRLFIYIYLIKILHDMKNQCIIFVPTKKECEIIGRIFKGLYRCTFVYSDTLDRDKNIGDFKDKKYQFIFSTTVLERGITIKDVNVVILYTKKDAFDKGSLIQMLGRVGRNVSNPFGDSYILSSVSSGEIKEAVNDIKESNRKGEMSILRQGN